MKKSEKPIRKVKMQLAGGRSAVSLIDGKKYLDPINEIRSESTDKRNLANSRGLKRGTDLGRPWR
jgi:hypothetical protein